MVPPTRKICKTLFGIVIFAGQSFADILESHLSQGTDASGQHLFLTNPAIVLPKETAVSSAILRRWNDNSVTTSGGNPQEASFKVTEDYAGISFVSPAGPGFGLGLTGQFSGRDSEGKLTGSQGTSKAVEVFRDTSVAGKVIIGMTDTARIGVLIRSASIEANILGSFFAGDDDRTTYRGSLMGYGAGALVGNKEGSLGLVYFAPMRGKAKVEGEDKVLADAGLGLLEGAFIINPTLKIGLGIKKWFHQRDDRSKPETSPLQQTNISLNGVEFEKDLFAAQALLMGVEFLPSNNLYVRLTAVQQQSEFIFDGDEVPGKGSNEDNRLNHSSAKAALGLGLGKTSLQFGYSYGQRKHSANLGNGAKRDYKALDRNFFAIVSSMF